MAPFVFLTPSLVSFGGTPSATAVCRLLSGFYPASKLTSHRENQEMSSSISGGAVFSQIWRLHPSGESSGVSLALYGLDLRCRFRFTIHLRRSIIPHPSPTHTHPWRMLRARILTWLTAFMTIGARLPSRFPPWWERMFPISSMWKIHMLVILLSIIVTSKSKSTSSIVESNMVSFLFLLKRLLYLSTSSKKKLFSSKTLTMERIMVFSPNIVKTFALKALDASTTEFPFLIYEPRRSIRIRRAPTLKYQGKNLGWLKLRVSRNIASLPPSEVFISSMVKFSQFIVSTVGCQSPSGNNI